MNNKFNIGESLVGDGCPVYFIADIAASHDGDLDRALMLINKAAEKGANAAKFQHFNADTIVSDEGFKRLGNITSHQSEWSKSVYEVYEEASLNKNWTSILSNECKKVGIDFFTSPYSLSLVDYVEKYVPAFKIGSGDITWHEIIEHIALKNKPVILASGASKIDEVIDAVNVIEKHNQDICLMQCNTNYTASIDNFKYINLKVLETYRVMYPDVVIGLSDHTPGHSTVLGAVSLGAKIIEKHFTDDNNRIGPDHKFSMNPLAWEEMVERTRELEYAIGSGIKKIENNEIDTSIIQRRGLYLSRCMKKGEPITRDDVDVLRPSPREILKPNDLKNVIGRKLKEDKKIGDSIKWEDLA